jgi:hypothetical protein
MLVAQSGIEKQVRRGCGLCGVFSGAHHERPDLPEAALLCPEPWPDDSLTDEELAALEAEAKKEEA